MRFSVTLRRGAPDNSRYSAFAISSAGHGTHDVVRTRQFVKNGIDANSHRRHDMQVRNQSIDGKIEFCSLEPSICRTHSEEPYGTSGQTQDATLTFRGSLLPPSGRVLASSSLVFFVKCCLGISFHVWQLRLSWIPRACNLVAGGLQIRVSKLMLC